MIVDRKPIEWMLFVVGFVLSTFAVAVAEDTGDLPDATEIKVARSLERNGTTLPPQGKQVGSTAATQLDARPKPLNPNPTQPIVRLSEQHANRCLKTIGDSIGTPQVRDIDGQTHELTKLLSDRLTVLIFWNEASVLGAEQFRRIPVDILSQFAVHRVKVIAVNVQGELARTKQLTGDASDKIVSLVDTDATLFKQFATVGIPRTYVLDANGKILWFDAEYSLGMQRSLDNALTYFLKKK